MLTDEERESKQKDFRKVVHNSIKAIVLDAMGYSASSKMTFKTKVTLQKLIDYKFERETEEQKFKRFLSMADNIAENINIMYPFINLNGIDLSWTTEEIANKIFEIFEIAPEMNLENCPRLSEEERKIIRKKASKEQKDMEKKLENIIRSFCRIPDDVKLERRGSLRSLAQTYITDRQEYNNTIALLKGAHDSNRCYVQSKFERDIVKEFPKLKRFYCGEYSNFTDIMRQIKKDYNLVSI